MPFSENRLWNIKLQGAGAGGNWVAAGWVMRGVFFSQGCQSTILMNWKIHLSITEFCPSLPPPFSLTDGVVGAYVQFDLNQTLSQFLHWHENLCEPDSRTLAVRNSSGEVATLRKNDARAKSGATFEKVVVVAAAENFSLLSCLFPLACGFFSLTPSSLPPPSLSLVVPVPSREELVMLS